MTGTSQNSYLFQVVCSSQTSFDEELVFWVLEEMGVKSAWSESLSGYEAETFGLLKEYPGNNWKEELARRLNEAGGPDTDWNISVRPYSGYDWLTEWKKFYKPEKAGGFWILPEWENPEMYEGAIVRIDPGMGFGTGGHPTTRMCLLFMEEILKKPGFSLLDMGTGSGILAIAASKLKAGFLVGVDNDAVALENAEKNTALNGVSIELRTSAPENTRFDFIVSNILAETHVELSGEYRSSLKAHGKIVLSGILETKKEPVLTAMSKKGFQLENEYTEGEWISLLLSR